MKPMPFENVEFTGIYVKTCTLTMWKKKSNNIKRIIREINLHSVLAKIPSSQLHIGILTVWKWVIKNDYYFLKIRNQRFSVKSTFLLRSKNCFHGNLSMMASYNTFPQCEEFIFIGIFLKIQLFPNPLHRCILISHKNESYRKEIYRLGYYRMYHNVKIAEILFWVYQQVVRNE